MSLVASFLGVADSGMKLTSQVLARTSPRELKEFEGLQKEKLELTSKINAYKRRLPSNRNQAELESYVVKLGEVCAEITIMQEVCQKKLEFMLAQLDKLPANS